MSKPWGRMSSWAAEAEAEEEKERAATESFPRLKEAVVNKQKKKKMGLSEFYDSVGKKDSSFFSKGWSPKERSVEKMQYGGMVDGGFRRDSDQDGAWGFGGGFDEERRGGLQSRVSDFKPSRADGIDEWASGKKSFPVGDQSSGVSGDGVSKADEVHDWAVGKHAVQSRQWFQDANVDSGKSTRGGSFRENNGPGRTRLVLEPRSGTNVDNVAVRTTKPSPFGAARPREEVLSEKGLDWKKIDLETEGKGISRPISTQSSRPNSAQSGGRMENVSLQSGVEAVVKSKLKVNPFGDAKPREVLLEEKGKDWQKMDMELERRVNRPETDEEISLKEEIIRLEKELEKEPISEETRPDAPIYKT